MSHQDRPPKRPTLLSVDDDPAVARAIQRLRGEDDALLLSDHRMPEMDGVEFLRRATHLFPDAKRVLLTAYADSDAAIRAINDAALHHFLLKPWDPPEENLYPVLSDLLDAEHNPEADVLLQLAETTTARLPVIVFDDGSALASPTRRAIAARIGLSSKAGQPFYDITGGQAGQSSRIENYLGFPSGFSGADLSRRARMQALRFGAALLSLQDAIRLEIRGAARVVIGAVPRTEWLGDAVSRDAHGFVATANTLSRVGAGASRWALDRDPMPLECSVPGISVAGEVRAEPTKRVASAVGEGAMAVQHVHRYPSDL